MGVERDAATAWYLDRRYLLAGALLLSLIWAVECLRKGGLIWPWPLVPAVIWAAAILVLRRSAADPDPDRSA